MLFKQYIEVHWSQNSEKFEEPEVDTNIKLRVKQILPIGLNDQSSKIRLCVAYSIAKLASWDWPENWPDLFDLILAGLNGNAIGNQQTGVLDLNVIHGCLETLKEFVPELTDLQVPHVAPVLLPQMYKIFIDPQNYSIRLRLRAIEIFNSLTEVIGEMAEYDSTAGKKYLFRFIPDFTCAMIKVLSLSPEESANIVDNTLKREIIKVI